MTPERKPVPYAELVALAWLVRRTRCAQLRGERSPADRATAAAHQARLDARVAELLGEPAALEEGGAA